MKMILPLLLIVAFACGKEKPKPLAKPQVTLTAKDNEQTLRDDIIAYARQQMGTPYCYASADPEKGFDCSGFVNYVFKHFDIDLPRSSSGFATIGKAVKPDNFRVGDVLVFTGYRDTNVVGHIGIICEADGMNSKFIHSSSGKEMAVIISSLNSDMYRRRFIKCVDVISSH